MDTNTVLKKLRVINKDLSYAKIAKILKVSEKSIYRWITGKNVPSGMALEKLEMFISDYEC